MGFILKTLRLTPRKAYYLISLILLALIALAYSAVADAAPAPIVAMGSSDTYARGSLPREGSWLGLYCEGDECKLRTTRVNVASSEHENALGEFEETEELAVLDEPIAIFHGMPLKTGPVTTWRGIEPSGRAFGGTTTMGRWTRPDSKTSFELSWSELPDGEGFRYYLGQGNRQQMLLDTAAETRDGEDVALTVHWVGDMDGDGKLDMLMSIAGESCSCDVRLYLSSLAGKDEFVGKAAHFSGGAPACGC
ncbi:MAG TPA: hypothetical protein VLC92_07575 [Rhodocyclaceae bacterium]|nr:hypothetical protein [Rhodocyclaceae bacterium]